MHLSYRAMFRYNSSLRVYSERMLFAPFSPNENDILEDFPLHRIRRTALVYCLLW